MTPLVTIAEFEALKCNRCGDCCETFWCDLSPFDIARQVTRTRLDRDRVRTESRWLREALIPIASMPNEHGRWVYRCRWFERESQDVGTCLVYSGRPYACSGVPYGRPQTWWPRCSWNVDIELVGLDGTV